MFNMNKVAKALKIFKTLTMYSISTLCLKNSKY